MSDQKKKKKKELKASRTLTYNYSVNTLYITCNPDYNEPVVFVSIVTSRICYPVTRLDPDSRSHRLPFLPASGHYANEDAPDQGENLRISAKSDRTSRAQEGKSREKKRKRERERRRERERKRREPFARARGYLYSDRFPIIGGTNERENSQRHRRKGGTGERIVCVIGIHLWACMSCRSLLSLVSSALFRASPDR